MFNVKRDNKNEMIVLYSLYVMIQVDRFQWEGYMGKGIIIVIFDMGIDYFYLVLGGCFGEDGCFVIKGWDFVGDDYNG